MRFYQEFFLEYCGPHRGGLKWWQNRGGIPPPIAGAGGNPGGITEILDIFSFDHRNIKKLIN
jgi:hypothetical protein